MIHYTKRIIKMHRRIKDLAQHGDESVFDYYKYIDEIVNNGDMYLLEDVMNRYYLFDIAKIGSVNNIKIQTWPIIKFATNSLVQESMSDLFRVKGVYQQGLEFYLSADNTRLGEIGEFDINPNEYKYYYLNREFSELTKMVRTGLNVTTYYPSPTASFVVNELKDDLSYNSNLIYNYALAIDLLIRQLNSNSYVGNYWVGEYAV